MLELRKTRKLMKIMFTILQIAAAYRPILLYTVHGKEVLSVPPTEANTSISIVLISAARW
jgi:hypothetical protein